MKVEIRGRLQRQCRLLWHWDKAQQSLCLKLDSHYRSPVLHVHLLFKGTAALEVQVLLGDLLVLSAFGQAAVQISCYCLTKTSVGLLPCNLTSTLRVSRIIHPSFHTHADF